MANPYRGEYKSTQIAKGHRMGCDVDFLPDRAEKIAGTSVLGRSYPMPTQSQPQMPENKHGPGYNNDTSGWVHGEGETGENKPGFDKKGSP